MSKIVMYRIDDRLIHGQVIVGWLGLRNANSIWIVDDNVATNPMMLDIFRFAAPTGVKLEAFTVDQVAERLANLDEGNDRIILLAKVPKTFVRLAAKGFIPEEINYGAMASKKDSITFGPNCDLSPEEIEDTEKLYQLGVHIWLQLVPMGVQKSSEWKDVRKKIRQQES
jgi:D-glucosaminate-specific PTS system IIB component